ncbi:retrotransposon protein, putative, unclassified [Tanacetum coccineum]
MNIVNQTVSAADIENNDVDENIVYECIDDLNMPNLEEIVYSNDDEEVSAEADMNNLATNVPISPIPTKDPHAHPLDQIIENMSSAPQTRRMTKNVTEQDPSWIEEMQDELLQFKLQKVWTLVDLPHGKRAIGNKWVYRNKKDDRGIVMDVKSAFLYGTIKEEVYVCQPLGFEDPEFPNKVYKVEKALYVLHQAPRAWYATLSTYILENRFRRGTIDKTLFIKKDKGELTFFLGLQMKQKDDGIFISQDKYVADILKKFDFATVKTTNTPIETNKALLKDEKAEDVDVYLYRSMIGSLMDSPFNLEAFSDSDYARASLDRKSTTGGYVATANCCGQNPVFHSKTKHIEIRHHFIRDSYKKKLIQVIKIHTDHNVADLLTKAFDVSRFEAASKKSNDPSLSVVNTLGSGEDSMKLMELMELCTKLSERILDNKNKKSDLVRKRNARYSELKNRKRAV